MRVIVPCVFAALFASASVAVAAGPEPKSEEQKTFYAIGVLLSGNLSTFNLSKSDLEMVKAGLSDGVLNQKPKVDVNAYRPKIQELQKTRMASVMQRQKQAGAAYAEKTAGQKGATRTASGMVYVPLKPGSGASPAATDQVKVHYKGTLIDGKVFDSSIERGEPVTFGLNQVIRCWTEGLQLMKVGGKSRLVCPSDIAYGDTGRPPVIPPGATLVFEVDLLDIVKP